jgi:SAM-dependent methyltransferase
MSIDVSGFKEGQKAMWTAGDYPEVSRRIASVAELLVERLGAQAGHDWLDVATGSGNVAIPAARAGAKVTGLDLTPKLLDVARNRAANAGLEIEFVEGDAEELPFEPDSFDRVSSCFGVMFAPRQQLAATELVRIARPGAMIGVAAWTPEGFVGSSFKASASYMPPMPTELKPAVMWGNEEHVRSLFAGSGGEITCERRTVTFSGPTVEGWMADDERMLGPAVMAKAMLESQGRYEELRGEMLELYNSFNEAGDGSFRVQAEYLLTLVQLPG